MPKFNLTVEYDFFDEYNPESFHEMVARYIAEEIKNDVISKTTGSYYEHIEKVSTETKNEVSRQIVNMISAEIIAKLENKIEAKLNLELNKLLETKLIDKIQRKIEQNIQDNIKGLITTQERNTFKNI